MLKNWFNYSAFGVVNAMLTSLNALLLAKVFSVEAFGAIALINAVCMFLTQILPFNALGYVPVLYRDPDVKANSIKKQYYFAILGCMSLIMVPISALVAMTYFGDWSIGVLTLLFCVAICLNDFDNHFSIQHSLSRRYGIAILISRSTFFCLVLLVSFLEDPSIHLYLVVGAGAEVLSAFYRKNIYEIDKLIRFEFALSNTTQRNFILSYGIKYLPLTVLGWVFMFADRFVISDRLSLIDVAKYAIATTIATAVVLPGNAVANTVYPGIFRLKLDRLTSYVFYIKIQLYLLIGGVALSIILFYSAPYILYVLGRSEYDSLAELVFILSLAFTLQGVAKIPTGFLDANILYLSKSFLFGFVGLGALFINIYLLVDLTITSVAFVFLISNASIWIFSNVRVGCFILRQK